MAVRTRKELLDRIAELEEQNEELQEKVDSIAEIVGGRRGRGRRGRTTRTPTPGLNPAARECGASWRKPSDEISDRAKRYRAQHPECRPPGPAKCALCGSTRFLVIDHKDGDESNGDPDNLR